MGCEQMIQRMSFVLNRKYMENVDVHINEENIMIVRIDLHGMKRNEALKAIKEIILLNRNYFWLDIIHGYTHGTVLKNMIQEDLRNKRIGKRWGNAYNHGRTFLEICEL